eukprot:747104-Hanusia_phi.AAC.2
MERQGDAADQGNVLGLARRTFFYPAAAATGYVFLHCSTSCCFGREQGARDLVPLHDEAAGDDLVAHRALPQPLLRPRHPHENDRRQSISGEHIPLPKSRGERSPALLSSFHALLLLGRTWLCSSPPTFSHCPQVTLAANLLLLLLPFLLYSSPSSFSSPPPPKLPFLLILLAGIDIEELGSYAMFELVSLHFSPSRPQAPNFRSQEAKRDAQGARDIVQEEGPVRDAGAAEERREEKAGAAYTPEVREQAQEEGGAGEAIEILE